MIVDPIILTHFFSKFKQFFDQSNRFVSFSAHIMQIFQRRQQLISEVMIKGYLRKHIQTDSMQAHREVAKSLSRMSTRKKIANKN